MRKWHLLISHHKSLLIVTAHKLYVIHNPNFKVVEFHHFRRQAGLPNFVMSVSEWIEKTNAIGIIVKKGRYGGTYAFKDIRPVRLKFFGLNNFVN